MKNKKLEVNKCYAPKVSELFGARHPNKSKEVLEILAQKGDNAIKECRELLLMKLDQELRQHDSKVVAELERNLRYISAIVKQKGREILVDYSITPPQFVALQWLFEEGDMTIGELSNKMHLACSTTTDLIDRMEKKELVMRVRDPKDRRVVRIHLLEKGETIIGQAIEKRQAYLQNVIEDFASDDVLNLTNYLSKLHQDMRKE